MSEMLSVGLGQQALRGRTGPGNGGLLGYNPGRRLGQGMPVFGVDPAETNKPRISRRPPPSWRPTPPWRSSGPMNPVPVPPPGPAQGGIPGMRSAVPPPSPPGGGIQGFSPGGPLPLGRPGMQSAPAPPRVPGGGVQGFSPGGPGQGFPAGGIPPQIMQYLTSLLSGSPSPFGGY